MAMHFYDFIHFHHFIWSKNHTSIFHTLQYIQVFQDHKNPDSSKTVFEGANKNEKYLYF